MLKTTETRYLSIKGCAKRSHCSGWCDISFAERYTTTLSEEVVEFSGLSWDRMKAWLRDLNNYYF